MVRMVAQKRAQLARRISCTANLPPRFISSWKMTTVTDKGLSRMDQAARLRLSAVMQLVPAQESKPYTQGLDCDGQSASVPLLPTKTTAVQLFDKNKYTCQTLLLGMSTPANAREDTNKASVCMAQEDFKLQQTRGTKRLASKPLPMIPLCFLDKRSQSCSGEAPKLQPCPTKQEKIDLSVDHKNISENLKRWQTDARTDTVEPM